MHLVKGTWYTRVRVHICRELELRIESAISRCCQATALRSVPFDSQFCLFFSLHVCSLLGKNSGFVVDTRAAPCFVNIADWISFCVCWNNQAVLKKIQQKVLYTHTCSIKFDKKKRVRERVNLCCHTWMPETPHIIQPWSNQENHLQSLFRFPISRSTTASLPTPL